MNRTNPAHRVRIQRSIARALAVCATSVGVGCAGGSSEPDCSVEVLKLEKWQLRPGALDAAYRVRGTAGAPGVVSLVAKLGPQNYITGPGVQVGPGPFVAIVDLKLTGVPPELLTLLEVGGERCSDEAKKPT